MAEVDIGSETYTTYADVDTAVIYATGAIHGGPFLSASVDTQGQALVTSTRILDRQVWLPAYDTFEERIAVPNIVNASIELAISLISDPTSVQYNSNTSEKIRSMTAGSVSITNFFQASYAYATRFPLTVQELLRGYLGSAGELGGLHAVATGVDGESIFPIDLGYSPGGL